MQVRHRLGDLAGIVAPTYGPQDVVLKALHAHAHAVHAQRTQCRAPFGRDIVGIGLDGEFLNMLQFQRPVQSLDQSLQQWQRQLRRRAAAQIQGSQPLATQLMAPHGGLGHNRIDIGGACTLHFQRGKEVTVAAAACAKGDMDIHSGHLLSRL